MNSERIRRLAVRTALGMSLIAASWTGFVRPPFARAASVCTVVKLELEQKAALEREAFNAHLVLTNNQADTPLSSLRVTISIKDSLGNPADALFFNKVTDMAGVSAVDGTGTMQPAAVADIRWLIIPSPGAGGSQYDGTQYQVTAQISYVSGETPGLNPTQPAYITVYPQPLLSLEYLMPFEVFGVDPFTLTGSTEPFPLGLRVSNVGAGTAVNFQIDSAQPGITDNKQGLPISFQIIGAYLNSNPLPANTLTVPFGNIAPGGSSLASWQMTSSFSGRFTDFTVTATHDASLGGALTSLIQSVTTYTLMKDVLDDQPGHDAQYDLLVNIGTPRSRMEADYQEGLEPKPDALIDSDRPGFTTVKNVPAHLGGALSGSGAVLSVIFDQAVPTGTWVHASIPFPQGATVPLKSVVRSDGKVFNQRNAWIAKHIDKLTNTRTYYLHMLDYTSTSSSSYSMTFDASSLVVPPDPISSLNAQPAGNGALALNWNAAPSDIVGGRYAIFASTDPSAVPSVAAAMVTFSTVTAASARQDYLLPGLLGNASYYVSVFLADAAGTYSAASNLVTKRTAALGPQAVTPGAASPASLDFSWLTAANLPGAAYRLVLSSAGGTVSDTGYLVDASSVSFNSLAANTTYVLSAQARNADLFESPAEVVATAVTHAFAPLALPFTGVGLSSATASWAANGNPDGTQYRVELSTAAGGQTVADSGWIAATSYAFTSLAHGALYRGQVRARSYAAVETAAVSLGTVTTQTGDVTPPVTTLSAGAPNYAPSTSTLYAAQQTAFSLSAADVSSGDVSGVAATYLAIDTTTFSVYGGTFSLVAEGAHAVSYYSVDAAGNAESASTTTVSLDLTAPSVTLLVQGSSVAAGAPITVSTSAQVSFSALDPVSNGVASGLRSVLYVVDSDPLSPSCSGVTPDTVAAQGTCANPLYVSPFTLSAGTHTVYSFAEDNVGNRSAQNISSFTVNGNYVSVSTDGAATIASSRADETIVPVSSGAVAAAYAVAVGSQGLVLRMPYLYELSPSPVAFVPQARLSFRFNPVGVDTATVGIYRFNGVAWDSAPITGQQIAAFGGGLLEISGTLNSASLYAVFSLAPPPPAITSIAPTTGGNAGALSVLVSGSGIVAGAGLKLNRILGSGGFTASGTLALRSSAKAVRLESGKVLIAGGNGNASNDIFKTAALYDPNTGSWSATGSMGTPRLGHTMTLLPGGKVLVAGGTNCLPDCNSALNTAEVYDPASGTWSNTGPLAAVRVAHTATLLASGKVLVAGGGSSNNGDLMKSSAELYDPATGLWTSAGVMPSGAHFSHASARLLDGRVVVAGGRNTSANRTAAVDIYNPTTNSWSAGTPMTKTRFLHTLDLLSDGKLLAASGDDSPTLSSTELFDPGTGGWIAGPPLRARRINHTSARLTDGTILVIGGTGGISLAELYNPTLSTWTTVGSFACQTHTETLLANGTVLIAGGYDPNFLPVSSVYGPAELSISASNLAYSDGTTLGGVLDLTGQPLGLWDVVVTNPDQQSARLSGAFTIHDTAPPSAVGDLAIATLGISTAALTWTAPGGQGGSVASYDLRRATFAITSANFPTAASIPAPAPAAPGALQTASVALGSDSSVFVALRSQDIYGNVSSISNVASLARSTTLVNGAPEASIWATQPVSIAASSTGAIVSAAAAQGLALVSSVYDPNPKSVAFARGANAAFVYDPATLSALGVPSASLRIYQLSGGTLVALSSQTLSSQTVTAATASFAGALGLFGVVPAPVITAIAPTLGGNSGPLTVSVNGSGIVVGAGLSLNRLMGGGSGFTASGGLVTPRSFATAVRLANGKVLIAGGQGNASNTVFSSAELFDPNTGSWSPTGAMAVPRYGHTMTLLPDGKVLVTGGTSCISCFNALNTAELYDPASGLWSYTGSLTAVRLAHTATLLANGKVLVAGGGSSNNGDLMKSSAELYDPATGLWAAAGVMPSGAHFVHSAATLADGRVVVAGGRNTSAILTAAVDIYNPGSNTWSAASPMSKTRSRYTLNLLPNGKLLAAAGDDGTMLASTEIYDPGTGLWTAGASLSARRSNHASARLTDGTILVVGGFDGTGGGVYPSAAEQYDPVANTWSRVGSLQRQGNTETLLANGNVLVAGGNDSSGALAGSSIYGPASLSIVASSLTYSGGSVIGGVFDLTGQPLGLWDVVITNPNHLTARLANAFTIHDTASPSAVVDLGLSSIGLSTVTLQWTAPASPSGALTSYEIRYAPFPLNSANFASGTLVSGPAPASPGTVQSVSVGGLNGITAFYAALKSQDVYANVSPLSNVASMVRSAVAVGDQPELTFSANVSVTAAAVSTTAAPGTVVLATATAQGLTLVSSIYDLGPEGAVFNPNARLTFSYSTAALASLDLSPADIMIYQYVPGVGMVAVSSQTIDTVANTITGYVPSLSSIFAVFGVVKDRTAPVTSLVHGTNATFADGSGNLYASPAAGFGFSAYDPIVFGTATGVAHTNYRVDGSSTAAFSVYTSTFPLTVEGQRTLSFYSADYAGNVEVVRSSVVLVDATAPITALQVLGSSVTGVSGGLAVSSTTAFALSAADPVSNGVASGVSAVSYVVDADPASPACAGVPLATGAANGTCANMLYAGSFTLPPGAHSIYSFSKDNVGNAENRSILSVLVDTVAPQTVLLVDGSTATAASIILVSTDSLGFSASDSGAGVAQILYALDGSAEQVYISTFIPSAGSHTLAYRGVDRLGNVETAHQVALSVLVYDATPPTASLSIVDRSTLTTNAPVIVATYGDAGRGIDVSSVRLTLDAVDVTTLAVVSASSATFVPVLSQGDHVVSISLADLAGNQASATARFFADSVSPATILEVNGVAASTTALVIVSTDSLGFAATDSGVGVLETRYSLDGSTTEAVFVSTFSLAAGAHTLAFRSVDRAGNAEPAKTVSINVQLFDVTPPSLALSPVNGSTLTITTPALVASYADLGRGVDPASVRLSLDGVDRTSATAITSSSASFTPGVALAQGTHTVTASVSDLAGNAASASSAFFIDSLPPLTSLLVNGLAAGSTNLVLASTDAVSFAASDSGVGVLETRYSVDGTSEVIFTASFFLSSGSHALAFHSRDRADNVEAARTASISVQADDTTPPSLTLAPVNGSTITTTTPEIRASYSDLGRGVNPSSVHLSLDGQEVTSSATVSASSANFTPSVALFQGTHTVTATVADLAGNTSSALATFRIDSLPPLTALLVNGLAAGSTNLILASTDAVSFAASDSGVGVLETRYAVDGASEAVFTAAFFLSPGSHALAFHSDDRAGNSEAVKTAAITVTSPSTDTTPPLVRLDFPGNSGLGIEQAIGGVVNVRGAVSDASALTWTLEAAPGAAASSGFTAIASGAGNLSGFIAAWNTTSLTGYQTLRLRATDAFGNATSVTASIFVGNPVFNFSVGRKDSNVIVNKIKNPTGIAIRSDGLIWVASTDEDEVILLTSSGTVVAEVDINGGHGHEHDHDDDEGDGSGFKNPQGLAVDAANNLYVADKGNSRIVKLSADGSQVLLQIAKLDSHGKPKSGSGTGELNKPQDVAVDANGDIYAADSGNRRIQVFNSAGTFLRQFGAGVLLSTSEVRGIALTAEGLWVSDKEQERVFLFSRAGVLIKSIGNADSIVGEISRMRGVASDRLGSLYLIEPNRDRTQKFDPQGKGLLSFGTKAQATAAEKAAKRYLTQPIDAAVAPDGSIWITDAGRDRIVRYALPVTGGYGVAAYSAGGGAVASSSVEPAKRVVDHNDGATVSRDDGAGVSVPKGALAADLEITVDKGDENLDKEAKTAKRKEMKITAVSDEVQYGPEGTTFNAPVTLTLPYNAGLIASQGVREDELKVYYWNPTLKDWQAMPSTVDKQNKTVSALTNHFSAYQVGGLGGVGVAAIDDFGFRDGYAFPNPSRNGSAVTFRMQPGSVDSIEVRVYDVSGRNIHSSSDFRFLGAFDDGNGKGNQNTYDHVWDVSGVGSGVYTYVMTAKKSGQPDIHKTGKAGIIK